jgi:LysM repeat protein
MDLKSLIMESMNEAVANPYKDPAQAAKFASLTPQDQEWLTRGGGVPNIDDEIILSRAPNKGKPVAQAFPVAPASAAPAKVDNAATREKLAALLDKIEKTGSSAAPAQQAANPAATTPAATPPAATPPAATPPAAGGTYKIKSGDNLTNIAKANGTTVQAIMQANPQIKDANKISAGASLNLPGAAQSGQAANPAAAPAAPVAKAAPTSMMGDIDPNTGMPANPMPESINYLDDQVLLAIKNIKY